LFRIGGCASSRKGIAFDGSVVSVGSAARTDSPTHRPPEIATAVKRARDYIDAHFVENPTLDAISEAAGMSSYHLIRAFKHAVGIAPHAYLVQRRVAMAKHLLLKGQALRQVAIEVGYCDQGHLSREFWRFFGVPPSRSRR
jgi:AraC-like DNA-binding protein